MNIDIACQEDDNKRAIDMTVKVDTGQIACRIRGAEYTSFNDFTIRARRESGAMTELEKLRKRTVRWFLYCYLDDAHQNIAKWYVLDIFRILDLGLLNSASDEKKNPDGQTSFIHISLDELKQLGCIITNGEGV